MLEPRNRSAPKLVKSILPVITVPLVHESNARSEKFVTKTVFRPFFLIEHSRHRLFKPFAAYV